MKKMKTHILRLLICMLATTSTYASGQPIRTVTYNPESIVSIYTGPGTPTLIQFEQGETIDEESSGMLGIGDAKAWSVGAKRNTIIMKPVASAPDTSMVIVSNRRTYAFRIKSRPRLEDRTLILRFDYAKSRDLTNKRGLASSKSLGTNSQYMKQGDQALSPTKTEDNGTFTYFSFDTSRDLPVIYRVMPDGTEILTNSHVIDDENTIVVHEVAEKFHLRLGNAVMAIRNDGYRPSAPAQRPQSTIPNTTRTQRGSAL